MAQERRKGLLVQRGAAMPWVNIVLMGAQAHLWGKGYWGGTQGLLLERHGLQGHLPGLRRVGVSG